MDLSATCCRDFTYHGSIQFFKFKRIVIHPFAVKDFTEKTLVINYSAISKDIGVNRKEVEMVINQIIVDKYGVDLEEVTPEKKIGDDLGIS